jgi:hypothetical protein
MSASVHGNLLSLFPGYGTSWGVGSPVCGLVQQGTHRFEERCRRSLLPHLRRELHGSCGNSSRCNKPSHLLLLFSHTNGAILFYFGAIISYLDSYLEIDVQTTTKNQLLARLCTAGNSATLHSLCGSSSQALTKHCAITTPLAVHHMFWSRLW